MNSAPFWLFGLTVAMLLIGCSRDGDHQMSLREKYFSIADCQLIISKAAEADPAIRRRHSFFVDEIVSMGKKLGVYSAGQASSKDLRSLGRETAVVVTWNNSLAPEIEMRVRTLDGVEEWTSDSNGKSKVKLLAANP